MIPKRRKSASITLTTMVSSLLPVSTIQLEGRTILRRKKHLQEKYFEKDTQFSLFDNRISCDGLLTRKLIFLITDYEKLPLEERNEIQELYPFCIGFKLKKGWNLILCGKVKDNDDTVAVFSLENVFSTIETEKKMLQNLFSKA